MKDTTGTTRRRVTHAAVAVPLMQSQAVVARRVSRVLAVILGLLGILLIL